MSTASVRASAGSRGSVIRAEHGDDVGVALALHAALDGLDHQSLHIDRVHSAVRADAPREPDREPSAARSEVGDDGAFRDVQRIHHLIGLLPRLAIGRFEQSEILRSEQPRLASPALPAVLLLSRRQHERAR